MDVLKLLVIFAFVMVVVAGKLPIYAAMAAGTVMAWLLYAIPVGEGLSAILRACSSWDTISLIVVVYIITVLQNMMIQRNAIERARAGLSSLFNHRWVNCAVAPIFIGMLPTPNAAFIAGDIVKASAGDYLDDQQQAVVTTYFRHVSESFMPTYNSILTALVLSGVAAGEFVPAMLPVVAVIIASGCFWFLRGKVPTATGEEPSKNKMGDLREIFTGLWAILAIIVLVVAARMEVYAAGLLVTLAYMLIHRFPVSRLRALLLQSFQWRLYLNTIGIMIFKEFLSVSGAINGLTASISALPLPSWLVFVLTFFFGGIVSGSTAMIVLCLPVAMATVPGAGLPLLVLLMGTVYAAMQVSPTHICLSLTADYFGIPLGTLFRKTLPAVLTTVGFTVLYYLAMTHFFNFT